MTTLPNHANSNHIYHYSAHLLKYKYIMKKIFTLILVAMAISLGASAQETSLRDQLVGMYGGTCLGYASYSDPTANGVYYSNTYNSDIPAVLIFPGEEDNELIISNFFPKADGINLDDIYCTLTETSAYADYGIVAYLSVENDVLGSFTKGGVEYDLDLVEMDYSWGVNEPPYIFWVYSDGSIETNCYADLHYKQDFSGIVYDMYLDVRYAKLTPVNSGVQGIAADMTTVNNAPVEYFSINGMRVNGNNLVPGLYIKRQGTQVTKVIVK